MDGAQVICTAGLVPPMHEPPTLTEQGHLESAHHEICTALTVLRSNVELLRLRLSRDAAPDARVEIHAHLGELDLAVDRLRRLAGTMRRWHDGATEDVAAVHMLPIQANVHP